LEAQSRAQPTEATADLEAEAEVRILSFEQVDVLLSDTSIDSQVHRELCALAEVTRRRALSRNRGV